MIVGPHFELSTGSSTVTGLSLLSTNHISGHLPSNNFVYSGSSTSLTALPFRGAFNAIPPPKLDVFDLTRSRINIESVQGYVVIAALFMNAALRLFSAVPKKIHPNPEKDKNIQINNIATYSFIVSISVSVLTGIFTSTIFSLLSLYSKTALARGLDSAFLTFLQRTHGMRTASFYSMILQLVSFSISFVFSLFLNMTGKPRWIVSTGLSVGLTYFWTQVSKIMAIATELIFS